MTAGDKRRVILFGEPVSQACPRRRSDWNPLWAVAKGTVRWPIGSLIVAAFGRRRGVAVLDGRGSFLAMPQLVLEAPDFRKRRGGGGKRQQEPDRGPADPT